MSSTQSQPKKPKTTTKYFEHRRYGLNYLSDSFFFRCKINLYKPPHLQRPPDAQTFTPSTQPYPQNRKHLRIRQDLPRLSGISNAAKALLSPTAYDVTSIFLHHHPGNESTMKLYMDGWIEFPMDMTLMGSLWG